jgi:hypothetical protein
MGNAKLRGERPLSPHLQIYRPMLTMMMSIAHRLSGAANAAGFILLAWWLIATGPEAYAQVSSGLNSIPGRLVLFLFTWSLVHPCSAYPPPDLGHGPRPDKTRSGVRLAHHRLDIAHGAIWGYALRGP